MATEQAYINETIGQIAAVAVKAPVQAILAERGDEDELTRHRSEEAGMKPKLYRPSPTFNFKKEVKNLFHTHNIDKAENIHVSRNSLGRQILIQAEQEECNETVKCLKFCKLTRHKSENAEEWIKETKNSCKRIQLSRT